MSLNDQSLMPYAPMITQRTFMAVDPGGAIAWSNRQGTFTRNWPDTRRDMIDLFNRILGEHEGPVAPVAYMEKVVAYIPDAGASSMFEYGRRVERPGCVMECLGIRQIEITPQSWQGHLSLGKSERVPTLKMPRGLTMGQKIKWRSQNKNKLESIRLYNARAKRDWKNKLKAESQRRFPDLKVTLFNCDALLILETAIKLEGE